MIHNLYIKCHTIVYYRPKMKVAIFSAVAVLAVLGFALADEGFNNFDNDDGGWGGWGVGRGVGSIGGVSSSWGKSWGGSGYGGMSYGSGYGLGYGSGYGMGYGGAGYGKGIGKVSYVPLPIGGGKAQGSGIFGLLRKYIRSPLKSQS